MTDTKKTCVLDDPKFCSGMEKYWRDIAARSTLPAERHRYEKIAQIWRSERDRHADQRTRLVSE